MQKDDVNILILEFLYFQMQKSRTSRDFDI